MLAADEIRRTLEKEAVALGKVTDEAAVHLMTAAGLVVVNLVTPDTDKEHKNLEAPLGCRTEESR